MNLAAVLSAIRGTLWALPEEQYRAIVASVEAMIASGTVTALSPGAQVADDRQDAVALVRLSGVIVTQSGGFWDEIFGVASHEKFSHTMRALADDSSVREIVVDINTPGGMVPGIDDSVAAMQYARDRKPVTSYVSGQCYSAGLWIGSQATPGKFVAGPNTEVGSLGALWEHVDVTKAEEMEGIKTTILVTSKLKDAGSPFKPLEGEAETMIRDMLMSVHDSFLGDVASGRGVSVEEAQKWATGARWTGNQALALGLVDSVGTMHSVIEAIAKPTSNRRRGARAGGNKAMDLEELKREHPELYNQIMEQGRTEGLQAAGQAPAAASTEPTATNPALEQEIITLRAQVSTLTQGTQEKERKNIANDALAAANLPVLEKTASGVDLNKSFRDQVVAASMAASSDDEARTTVESMVADRAMLLSNFAQNKSKANRASVFPPRGDTSKTNKGEQGDGGGTNQNHVLAARASVGL